MQNVISILKEHKIVANITVLKIIEEDQFQSIYLKVFLIDKTVLFIHETKMANVFRYSYHWQTKSGKLIIRWDNSPNHKNIETFPYHKHIGSLNKIESSHEINLESILKIISQQLAKKFGNSTLT